MTDAVVIGMVIAVALSNKLTSQGIKPGYHIELDFTVRYPSPSSRSECAWAEVVAFT